MTTSNDEGEKCEIDKHGRLDATDKYGDTLRFERKPNGDVLIEAVDGDDDDVVILRFGRATAKAIGKFLLRKGACCF